MGTLALLFLTIKRKKSECLFLAWVFRKNPNLHTPQLRDIFAQAAGAVEHTDCTSAAG